MREGEEISARLGDNFDKAMRSLEGLPDVVQTKPSTVVVKTFLDLTETFIVQTVRQKDEGDTIFLQFIGQDKNYRIVIPCDVADVIARQRDAVGTKTRKVAAKEAYKARKAAGTQPEGFKKKKK